MADALDPDDETIGEIDCSEVPRYDPPDWISTDWLETELWNAILDDASGSTEEDIDKYDDGFEDPPDADDDEEEDEEETRRSTFTLLVGMKPFLGELLGGPPIRDPRRSLPCQFSICDGGQFLHRAWAWPRAQPRLMAINKLSL